MFNRSHFTAIDPRCFNRTHGIDVVRQNLSANVVRLVTRVDDSTPQRAANAWIR
jgi:hypothetical protein